MSTRTVPGEHPGSRGDEPDLGTPGLGAVSMTPVLSCRGVTVIFGRGGLEVVALVAVDLTIRPRERLTLWGRSGSGKSTLLHVLGGLFAPTHGRVEFEGRSLLTENGRGDGTLRPAGIANVFQSPNLLPHFTAFENVSFATAAAAEHGDADSGGEGFSPLELLRLVGLESKADSLPSELSGGEAQRVAVARALAQRPRLLLCDEPTGHLDSDTGGRVLDLIEALQREFGFALVLATHDPDVAARMPREVELLDGRIVREESHS
jgi:ABC-type lipoprotein export system ATPase subunit